MEICTLRYTWTALCLAMLAMMSGSVKSEEASSTFELHLDITNRIYNTSLLKPDTPDYKLLFSQVNTMLHSIYGCADCNTHSFYHTVSGMTFSDQTGTVLVKATLVFQTHQINADVFRDLFIKAFAENNELNNLKINPKFTQVLLQSTSEPPSSSTTISTHPTIHPTTKHHNSASSFTQTPASLTPFLRYSASFCVILLVSYSF